MKTCGIENKIGPSRVNIITLEAMTVNGNDLSFNSLRSLNHYLGASINIDAFFRVGRNSRELMSNSGVEARVLTGGDLRFELYGMRKTEGNPEGNFRL